MTKAKDQLKVGRKVSPYFMALKDKPGVYFQPPPTTTKDADGNETTTPSTPLWICSPLEVSARVRDEQGQNHGVLLEWDDQDNRAHKWIMPLELLAGDGAEVRRVLLSGGVKIATKKATREHLLTYIQDANPEQVALSVFRTGWQGNAFVLPDEVIGDTTKQKIFLQSDFTLPEGYETAGKAAAWRDQVSAACVGNHRLVFAIATAFASPLLTPLNAQGVGFHFRGASSIGKTTLLRLAMSVCGDHRKMHQWRATDNALEALAALHNDALLCLDELGEADPKAATAAAYMLANGKGKGRSTRGGELRRIASWRLLFLSTGELSLADLLASDGKKIKAGQLVRIVDIPAEAGKGLGIFDTLPEGFSKPGAFADHLKEAVTAQHGAVLREYLVKLAGNLSGLLAAVQDMRSEWKKVYVPEQSSGQVLRVADAFAIVAAAGELATDMGLTGWEAGAAGTAAAHCFDGWLHQRGGFGSQEERDALKQVKYFFEQNGASMFTYDGLRLQDDRTMYRKGYRDEAGDYFVFPEAFERDVCRGFDRRFVIGLLKTHGLLVTGTDSGRNTINKRITQRSEDAGGATTSKTIRCYHITAAIMELEL
jgi:putative DNA primase/helicase